MLEQEEEGEEERLLIKDLKLVQVLEQEKRHRHARGQPCHLRGRT